MKTVKTIQMQTFEGSDLRELQERFNSTMRWVSNHKYIDHVIDLPHLNGYVIYEATEKTPECVKDILELESIFLRCGQCKKFCRTYNHRGECEHCKGVLRDDDEACDKFFDSLEGDCWLNDEEDIDGIKARINCKPLAQVIRKKA